MGQSKEERNVKAREAYARRQGKASVPVVTQKAISKAVSKSTSVAGTWIRILSGAVGKGLPDGELAKMMCDETGRTGYVASDVARHRSLYNRGKIKGQTSAPSKQLVKHE